MGEYRTTDGEVAPLPTRERRLRARWFLLLGALALVSAIAVGFRIPLKRRITASGYVTTEKYAEVRPPTTGIVAEILTQTGARVKEGDLLVRLDSTNEAGAVAEARSLVRKTETELARLEAEIAEQKRLREEAISKARLQLQYTSNRLARTRELLAKGLIAGSALEDDQLKEDLAKTELSILLNKNQELFERQLAVTRQDLEVRNEAVRRAETALRTREVRAPIAGEVLRYEFVIGELIHPENVLLEIFGGQKQVLKARVPERYASKVHVGFPYRAKLAPYRGLQWIWFHGEVQYLRDVIQSEGNTSYRVAYCSFDPRTYTVQPGTTAQVEIECGTVNLWFFLLGLD